MKEVKLTGRKQWKIAWFETEKCNSRNERYIEKVMKHVVRIWKSLACVIVIAIVIEQSRWMVKDKQYSKYVTFTNGKSEIETNSHYC